MQPSELKEILDKSIELSKERPAHLDLTVEVDFSDKIYVGVKLWNKRTLDWEYNSDGEELFADDITSYSEAMLQLSLVENHLKELQDVKS